MRRWFFIVLVLRRDECLRFGGRGGDGDFGVIES